MAAIMGVVAVAVIRVQDINVDRFVANFTIAWDGRTTVGPSLAPGFYHYVERFPRVQKQMPW